MVKLVICDICGTEETDNFNYCSLCGAKLEEITDNKDNKSIKLNKKLRLLLAAGIGIITVLVACF